MLIHHAEIEPQSKLKDVLVRDIFTVNRVHTYMRINTATTTFIERTYLNLGTGCVSYLHHNVNEEDNIKIYPDAALTLGAHKVETS